MCPTMTSVTSPAQQRNGIMESSAWRGASWGDCGRQPEMVPTWRGAANRSKHGQRRPLENDATRFLQAGCPSCHPTNSVKELKRKYHTPHTCSTQAYLGSLKKNWRNKMRINKTCNGSQRLIFKSQEKLSQVCKCRRKCYGLFEMLSG